MSNVKNCRTNSLLLLLCLVLIASSSFADRLHHIDGSVIEGRITQDSGGVIRIDTKYGQLNYERKDLLRIERTAATAMATSGTAAAAPVNLMRYVPRGPVNPFSPPQMPMLITLSQQPGPPNPTQAGPAR